MKSLTIEQVKKLNWKYRVISHIDFLLEHNKFDNTLSSLKSIVKMMIETEERSMIQRNIIYSKECQDDLTNKLY